MGGRLDPARCGPFFVLIFESRRHEVLPARLPGADGGHFEVLPQELPLHQARRAAPFASRSWKIMLKNMGDFIAGWCLLRESITILDVVFFQAAWTNGGWAWLGYELFFLGSPIKLASPPLCPGRLMDHLNDMFLFGAVRAACHPGFFWLLSCRMPVFLQHPGVVPFFCPSFSWRRAIAKLTS